MSEDGSAYAIYYVRFTEGHRPPAVSTLVSVGDWADDAPPSSRVAVALELSVNPEGRAARVLERSESPWQHVEIMGEVLSRDAALAHPRLEDVFHIIDHIADDDPLIRAHLSEHDE